jgi:hypothetical protein
VPNIIMATAECQVPFSTNLMGWTLLHCVWTGSEAHPASYPVGSGGSFPGAKVIWWGGGEVDHSLPSSTEVKEW